jgi:hypothetical protein
MLYRMSSLEQTNSPETGLLLPSEGWFIFSIGTVERGRCAQDQAKSGGFDNGRLKGRQTRRCRNGVTAMMGTHSINNTEKRS